MNFTKKILIFGAIFVVTFLWLYSRTPYEETFLVDPTTAFTITKILKHNTKVQVSFKGNLQDSIDVYIVDCPKIDSIAKGWTSKKLHFKAGRLNYQYDQDAYGERVQIIFIPLRSRSVYGLDVDPIEVIISG